MDPLTVAVIAAGVHAAIPLAKAHAETRTLRARIELARTVAELPPSTEISGGSHSVWLIRIPALLAQESPATLQRADNEDGVNV
jgi:hypothetical protein